MGDTFSASTRHSVCGLLDASTAQPCTFSKPRGLLIESNDSVEKRCEAAWLFDTRPSNFRKTGHWLHGLVMGVILSTPSALALCLDPLASPGRAGLLPV